MNSKQLDKGSPVSAFAVAQCYAEAQEGTFFEGSGYAALGKYHRQSEKTSLGFSCPVRLYGPKSHMTGQDPLDKAAARPFSYLSQRILISPLLTYSFLTSCVTQMA